MEVKAGVARKTTHRIVGEQDLTVLAGCSKSAKHRKAEETRDAEHPIRIIE
jgi:DNA polymerase-3 subunit epsilon